MGGALRPAPAPRDHLRTQPARPRRLADRPTAAGSAAGSCSGPRDSTGSPSEDLARVRRLGIATVFDLRTKHETDDQPDSLPDGISSVQLDVLADADRAAPAELQRIFSDPALAGEQLGDGQAERYFENAYRGFVTLPSARDAYHRLFEAIAEADAPVLFHCTTGKDRTGWATAVLFSLLGVADDGGDGGVPPDQHRPAARRTAVDRPVRGGRRRSRAADADPGRAAQLSRGGARGDAHDVFGTVEEYAATGLGLSPATIDRLRNRLVEPDVRRTYPAPEV